MRNYLSAQLCPDKAFAKLAGGLRRLALDTTAGVMIWIGTALPVILGVSGLGLDAALWYLERRVMQSAVDSAAISAALAKDSGGDSSAIDAAVDKAFADSNFPLRASDVLDVNVPPESGPNTSNSTAVELLLTRTPYLFLTQFVTSGIKIGTRAVAGGVIVGTHCIVALDKTADSAVQFIGTADAEIGCGVASNSNSDKAIHVGGKAVLKADPAQARGDIYVEGSATLETAHPPQPHSPAVPDPFGPDGRDLQIPVTAGACMPSPDLSGAAGTVFLNPGYYCGDLLIENKTVELAPGTYIIEDGDLTIKAGSVVTGDDVTFVFTGSNPAQVGTFEFTSTSVVDITAPTTGEYAGILIFEDPNAHSTDGSGDPFTNFLYGGATLDLKGAIYTPSRKTEFTGGATTPSDCLYIVARVVTVTGNAQIDNDPTVCSGLGLDDINQVRIRLIE